MTEADVVCMGIKFEPSYHYSIKCKSGKLTSDMKVLIKQMGFIEFLHMEKSSTDFYSLMLPEYLWRANNGCEYS